MSQFTNNLKPFYESGMSYNDFKFALDPRNGLSNIKPAGDNLLNEAYNYIVNDTHESNMDGNLILLSFINAFENNDTLLDRKGFDEVDDNDYDLIFRDLFGLTSSYEVPNLNKGGCKWYRIDCHVGWLIGEISEWWNTPAPGEGGLTNGQVLAGTIAATAAFVGLILLLL